MIDVWQGMGSVAAIIFSAGFVSQVWVTYRTRSVEGLSLSQWLLFLLASILFAIYYSHLEQWAMLLISTFGAACCLTIAFCILKFKSRLE